VGTAVVTVAPVSIVVRGVRWLVAPVVGRLRDELTRQLTETLDVVVPAVVEQVVSRIDLTELVRQHVDIERIVDGVDLAAITNEILAEIDLPEIIRQSTGSVASETVRGVRMQAISADDAVGRLSERFRLRRPDVTSPG
jgi:hypothetical protein